MHKTDIYLGFLTLSLILTFHLSLQRFCFLPGTTLRSMWSDIFLALHRNWPSQRPAHCSCHIPKVGGRPRATTPTAPTTRPLRNPKPTAEMRKAVTERGSLAEAQPMYGEENQQKIKTTINILSELREESIAKDKML